MTRRRFAYISIVMLVGLVVGFGGRIAWAAIPSGNTIHACYRNDSGVLRAIDPSVGDVCNPKSETALDWAQIGQQGVQGIQGLRGAQGATGAAGTDGVSNYQIVSATGTTAYDSFWQTNVVGVNATCPTGTVRAGIGFDLPSTQVKPFAIGGEQAEPYELYVMGDPNVTVTAYAVCVDQRFEGK